MKRTLVALAFVAMTPVAWAQPGLSTKPNYDLIDTAGRIDEGAQRDINMLHNQAVAALQSKDMPAPRRSCPS